MQRSCGEFVANTGMSLILSSLTGDQKMIGRFKIHSNVARFNRQPMNKDRHQHVNAHVNSSSDEPVVKVSQSALVLDESCFHNHDFSLSLVSKIKEFGSLPNLKKILEEEGFSDINIRYIGGFWVMIQFQSKAAQDNFNSHVGVNSWFSTTQHASDSFSIDKRVAWIDIEGVPLKVWSRNTFAKISLKWGSLLYEEDEDAPYFHRKRLCIKTTTNENIFYSFKIVVKGKIFWIRVKEVSGWAPNFSDSQGDSFELDNESVYDKSKDGYSEKESEAEEIPKTFLEVEEPNEIKCSITKDSKHQELEEIQSEDPFNLYDLLKRTIKPQCYDLIRRGTKVSVGFSPHNSYGPDNQIHVTSEKEHGSKIVFKEDVSFLVNSCNFKKPKTSGFMLQLIEDLIKVGANNRKLKWSMWTFSTSGLVRENSTVSDYFIVIIGKWLPNDKNFLIISVYAPQELSEKRMLWQYLVHVIEGWNDDVIIIGYFNEVRTVDERFGSIFNARSVAAFNSFISTGGLVEVPSGFDSFVTESWKEIKIQESNDMLKLVKKLKILKGHIRLWVKDKKEKAHVLKNSVKKKLADIYSFLDKGEAISDDLEDRLNAMNSLTNLERMESFKLAQKAKIKWSIEGDENSKYFHGIINKKQNNLAIRGIIVDGEWIEDPNVVKNEFLSHFRNRFDSPCEDRLILDMEFPNILSSEQA
ncbi:RNA-directed DNA polymerase, eukaryota [Tanacetum coccineum]